MMVLGFSEPSKTSQGHLYTMDKRKRGMQTLAVHAGERPDPTTGALVPPINLANTFHLGSTEQGARLFSGEKEGFVYSRWGNPTLRTLEARVAALEGGEAAAGTSSGMAAVFAAVTSVVRAGDHIVSAQAIYPSTYHLYAEDLRSWGIETTFVDATDLENIADAVRPNTKLIYLETPGNPLLSLVDLAGIAEIARKAGAVSICDNTFATPINQRPRDFGIDIVIHAATKYLGGHGDAVGGMIVGEGDFIKRVREGAVRYYGTVLSPFNSYLILRGIQTLPLRMRTHNENALRVAGWLEQQPSVERVSYPGLESHPQHALAKRQMHGFGGMISFEVKGGVAAGARLMNSLNLCSLATSLGDVRTLISHPASTTHVVVSREQRLLQGVSDGLVRLSVGIEDVDDIIADLEQGLLNIT